MESAPEIPDSLRSPGHKRSLGSANRRKTRSQQLSWESPTNVGFFLEIDHPAVQDDPFLAVWLISEFHIETHKVRFTHVSDRMHYQVPFIVFLLLSTRLQFDLIDNDDYILQIKLRQNSVTFPYFSTFPTLLSRELLRMTRNDDKTIQIGGTLPNIGGKFMVCTTKHVHDKNTMFTQPKINPKLKLSKRYSH